MVGLRLPPRLGPWDSLKMTSSFEKYATFKQIQEKGGKVNKGEKGCQVVFWKPTEYKTGEKDDSGDDVYKKSLICKFYYVFNLDN